MATKTGAAEHFFKLNEGKPGDGVCALFDSPDKKLRIYCIDLLTLLSLLEMEDISPKTLELIKKVPP